MDGGLSREGFGQRIMELMAASDYDWIVEARGLEGPRPVGIILGRAFAGGRAVEPSLKFFQWASARNRIEGAAAGLREIAKTFKVFIFSRDEGAEFWVRMCHYKLLHRGCKIRDHYAVGEDAMMFYTLGP